MRTSLSVVIPAYNEEANVAQCIQSIYQVLKKTDWDWEMIVVNDGSRDQTSETARREIKKLKITTAQVIDNNPNRGYGGSLKAGFAASTKDLIAFIPADNQFDFREIHELMDKYNETNADIISGIRANRNDPLHRKVIGWTWNTIVRALFGYLASDIDCGFKMFRREILNHVTIPAERGAMIDTQLFASARARGYKVAEVALTHLPRVAGNPTGVNPRVIYQSFMDLFVFWWQLRQEIMVEKGKAVFKWEFIAIVVILLVGLFCRGYRLSEYMTFLGDEGRDVAVVREIITGENFTIIGPGTSIGNMYLGPLYYYLMVIPLWMFGLSPVGPAVMVVMFGLATIALLWWIGRQWFERVPALIVTFLYAISPVVITYSHSSWNPNVMPFFALLSMYGIWKVWRYGYWRWLLVTAVSLAFVLNSHYLGLLIFPVVGFYWLLTKKNRSAWNHSLIALALFLLLMSPLFVFDAVHDWMNFRSLLKFFTERQTTVNIKAYKAIPNMWPLWVQINTSLVTAGNELIGKYYSLIVIVLAGWAWFKTRMKRDASLVWVWILVSLVGLGLYKQHIYDHYFGFLFPAVFLLLGFALAVIWKNKFLRVVSVLTMVGLVFVNLEKNPLRYPPNNQLDHARQIATFIQKEAGDQDFNLALLSKSNYDMSYRYFMILDKSNFKTVHQRITDQLFVICEDPACKPIGNPLWEIASFGWAKIDREWEFPWGVKLYKLVANPDGKPI